MMWQKLQDVLPLLIIIIIMIVIVVALLPNPVVLEKGTVTVIMSVVEILYVATITVCRILGLATVN